MIEGYNGWKNRQTWNVALWVGNDEPLYRTAVDYVERRKAAGNKPTWRGFIEYAWLVDERTPDNVSFSGTKLDLPALNEYLNDLLE